MKISTKGRYGLRALIDLAEHASSATPVFLSEIAKRQGVSEKYLEHIFSALNKGGIVKSQRGRKGGYFLSRPPERITLNNILTVLEGSCALVDCASDSGVCEKSEACVTREVWVNLGSKIEEFMDGYTLAALAEMQQLKGRQDSVMYYI